MKNPTDWSEGFGCGAMFVAIIYTIALAFFLHVSKTDFADYATIWVGVLALLGAWLTLRGIRDQNQINIDIFEKNESQKLAAAKAILPLLLADINESPLQNIQRNFPENIFPRDTRISRDFKPLEMEVIDRIKDYAPLFHPAVSARLGKILQTYQILKSRDAKRDNVLISGESEWKYGEHSAVDSAINWSVIYCMANSIYHYARDGDDFLLSAISANDVKSALFSAGIVSIDNSKLEKIIDTRYERGELEFKFR